MSGNHKIIKNACAHCSFKKWLYLDLITTKLFRNLSFSRWSTFHLPNFRGLNSDQKQKTFLSSSMNCLSWHDEGCTFTHLLNAPLTLSLQTSVKLLIQSFISCHLTLVETSLPHSDFFQTQNARLPDIKCGWTRGVQHRPGHAHTQTQCCWGNTCRSLVQQAGDGH